MALVISRAALGTRGVSPRGLARLELAEDHRLEHVGGGADEHVDE